MQGDVEGMIEWFRETFLVVGFRIGVAYGPADESRCRSPRQCERFPVPRMPVGHEEPVRIKRSPLLPQDIRLDEQ